MVSALTIQISFLLCESIICFLCGLALLFMPNGDPAKKKPLVIITFLGALLLLADFCAFVFRGDTGLINYIMVRVSNFLVFVLSDLIIYTFSLYLYGCIWGKMGIYDKDPAKIRMWIIHISQLVGVALVIISQFTHMYYYFDEENLYHRGPVIAVSLIIPLVGIELCASILVQYRKSVHISKFIMLLVFSVIPVVSVIIQGLAYGTSVINIMLGFGILGMFGEFVLWQSREVTRAEKTEFRTGLSNEHGCIEALRAIIERGEAHEYAVVCFNLLHFSLINRKYGMETGTQVIINYAKTLERYLAKDEFIARQGSDQFIVVVRKENLQPVLKQLDGLFVQFTYEEQLINVNISATSGIYQIHATDTDPELMISNATAALNYAKTVLKSSSFEQTDEIINQITERKQLEEILPEAIKQEEFLVYYQPKVNSKTEQLVGAEALVRWMHEGTLVPPGKFIPVMEENDLICSMDYYMLRHVCADLEKWITAGLVPPTISVNFSRRNLTNKEIAFDIDRIVREYHVPKKMIEIEITETVDEFPLSVLKEFVDELHRLGYKVAVDDFGCGSSSLSLLREITFDTLKIDKGFVDRAYAKDLTILGYIIKLAKAINLEILAEGVETEEQINTLLALGCEVIQGYYFDKPLPRDVMESRLINRKYYQEKK